MLRPFAFCIPLSFYRGSFASTQHTMILHKTVIIHIFLRENLFPIKHINHNHQQLTNCKRNNRTIEWKHEHPIRRGKLISIKRFYPQSYINKQSVVPPHTCILYSSHASHRTNLAVTYSNDQIVAFTGTLFLYFSKFGCHEQQCSNWCPHRHTLFLPCCWTQRPIAATCSNWLRCPAQRSLRALPEQFRYNT